MSMLSIIDKFPKLRGFTTIFAMKDGQVTRMFFHKNHIMNGAAFATAKVWGGYANYKVGAMYFEFQNLASPSDDPVYPSFVSSAGVEYFTGLEYAPDRDFLRVPILIGPSVSDTEAGQLLTLYAIAPDVSAGFFSKEFSGAVNSVVIGGALVATPDTNQSNDIVMCRNYPAGTKIPKTAGEQIGMVWNVEFPYPVES
jgi:hypothetical protein